MCKPVVIATSRPSARDSLCHRSGVGQPFSRDLRVDVTVNQIGFTPGASKSACSRAARPQRFEVIRTTDQKVAFSGPLAASNGDFGTLPRRRFQRGQGSGHILH